MKNQDYIAGCYLKGEPNFELSSDTNVALEEISWAGFFYRTPSFEKTVGVLNKEGLGKIVERAFNRNYRLN